MYKILEELPQDMEGIARTPAATICSTKTPKTLNLTSCTIV